MFCSFILYISLRVSTNNCSVDLYNGDLHTTTVFFTRNASSHKTDWILTTGCLLCLTFLYAHVNSLINIFEVECSRFYFLENSIATSLLFVYFLHITWRCVCILIYPLFSHTDVVGLLVTRLLYLFDWILITACLVLPFLCLRKQSDEHSWSRVFVFLLNRCVHLLIYPLWFRTDVVGLLVTSSLYLFDWILTAGCLLCLAFLYADANSLMNILEVVCVFCSHCLSSVRLLVYPLFSHTNVVGLLVVYCINVKRWYTVSIFVAVYKRVLLCCVS